MKPLVSLVTPVYNAMPYFREYLSCVKKQTWRPLEFILIDDGSTDGSWEYLRSAVTQLREEDIFVYTLRKDHAGQAAAINAALPLVTGEYLTWCDADDVMTTDSIEKKTEYLMSHHEVDMVRSDGIYMDGDSNRFISKNATEKDSYTQNIFDALFHGTTYCYAGCYMARTESFFKCYAQKQIPFSMEGQNLQMLLPLASRTDCGFLAEILHFYYRRHSGHSSRICSYTERLRVIEHFSRLRIDILPYCKCDQNYYIEEIRKIEKAEKRLLYDTAIARAREEIRGKAGFKVQ